MCGWCLKVSRRPGSMAGVAFRRRITQKQREQSERPSARRVEESCPERVQPMSTAETQLLQLLKNRSFKRGSFQLASGGKSEYYIDGKMTEVYSEAAPLIGQILYERTKDLRID